MLYIINNLERITQEVTHLSIVHEHRPIFLVVYSTRTCILPNHTIFKYFSHWVDEKDIHFNRFKNERAKYL